MRSHNHRRSRMLAGLARSLLWLYPEPWRDRYEAEMLALLEDDPPGVGALASLLGGALDAHLRPQRNWRTSATPAALMRLSVGGLFSCWILLSLAGSGFAKETEGFSAVESAHPLLQVARYAVLAGAGLGCAAIAVGGLPLLWQALHRMLVDRDTRLAGWIAAPALCLGALGALAVLLMAVAPSRHGFPASFALEIVVPLTLAMHAFALVCSLAPKVVMRRCQPGVVALRRACVAGQALSIAILLVCAGLLVYVPALVVQAPLPAEAPSGPYGLSTAATLCLSLAGAVAASAMALVASARSRRALRAEAQ